MTIFMEYPIIFIGYSISDSNIQKILKSIVNCLDNEQLNKLQNRFVFIEYKEGTVGTIVTPYTIMVNNKPLSMTKIQIEDFKILFDELDGKKNKLPVRLLRRFKQELYDYTITNTPTGNLRVAGIDDNRVADEELVMAIGKVSERGLRGISGIEANEIYRDIVMDDLSVDADDLLTYAYPKLLKQNSGFIPIFKYLDKAKNNYPDFDEQKNIDFEKLFSNTIRKSRNKYSNYTSVKQVWIQNNDSLERATRIISHLTEARIDIDELGEILKLIFNENYNVLSSDSNAKTHIRRLIRIYDYLKWKKLKIN